MAHMSGKFELIRFLIHRNAFSSEQTVISDTEKNPVNQTE